VAIHHPLVLAIFERSISLLTQSVKSLIIDPPVDLDIDVFDLILSLSSSQTRVSRYKEHLKEVIFSCILMDSYEGFLVQKENFQLSNPFDERRAAYGARRRSATTIGSN